MKTKLPAAIGGPEILLAIFVILKMTKVIKWRWRWVLSPAWGGVLLGIVSGIVEELDRRRADEMTAARRARSGR